MSLAKLIFGRKRPNQTQLKSISKVFITLGELVFGSTVIGFFIPGLTGEVTKTDFVLGLTMSIVCFIMGIRLLNKVKDK